LFCRCRPETDIEEVKQTAPMELPRRITTFRRWAERGNRRAEAAKAEAKAEAGLDVVDKDKEEGFTMQLVRFRLESGIPMEVSV